MRSKRNFSTYHLRAAVDNARKAGEIEKVLHQSNYGSRGNKYNVQGKSAGKWPMIHDSYAITSFISSFSAVETNINEFIKSIEDRDVESAVTEFDDSHFRNIKEFLSAYSRDFYKDLSTLDKYQLILVNCNIEPFNTGREPYQSINTVRKLRNYFVHHEPRWVDAEEDELPDSNLGRELKTKNFEEVPYIDGDSRPYFPDRCLSYGCAKWVLKSSLKFINEFYNKIGTNPPYHRYEDMYWDDLEVSENPNLE